MLGAGEHDEAGGRCQVGAAGSCDSWAARSCTPLLCRDCGGFCPTSARAKQWV